MGRSWSFECPKCGYKARVSGGPDRGFQVFIQTILCRDCKALYDAVIKLKVPDEPKPSLGAVRLGTRKSPAAPENPPAFESILNRLPAVAPKRFKWAAYKIRCPVSLAHRVQLWNDPDKCPRCGIFLEKNELPFRIWE